MVTSSYSMMWQAVTVWCLCLMFCTKSLCYNRITDLNWNRSKNRSVFCIWHFLNCLFLFCREWYLNGNYLVVLVSLSVILPLALMKQLGESIISTSVISSLSPPHESGFPCAFDPVEWTVHITEHQFKHFKSTFCSHMKQ